MIRMAAMRRVLTALLACLLVVACDQDTAIPQGPTAGMMRQGDFRGALDYYRSRLAQDPDDPELLEGYYRTYQATEEHFLSRAQLLARSGDFAGAEASVNRGLILLPDSVVLREQVNHLRQLKEARRLYREAAVSSRLGRNDQAMEQVEAALRLDPDFEAATSLLRTLTAAQATRERLEPIRLQTGAPVSINFQNAAFKDAALALGRAYGVNMIFDADLTDRNISVYADKVTFVQAFELLLKSNNAFYRRLGENSVIIASDTPGKRAQYSDYLVRTFFIRSGNAQEIADTLALTLGIQNASVDEAENTVTIRDTAETVLLADQLINSVDRRPAEVVMEVEVLEVNRTKTEQLGLELGSQITAEPPEIELTEVTPVEMFGDELGASAVTLPTATLRFYKQDVDARTLANPSIRTLDKQEASFHVGDEIPLRASEIVETSGQTRTTFERRNIGINLQVRPEVRLNSSVAVTLELEVSSLGQNLGTPDQPAYAIGTRRIQTRMLLENGETAIMGGLIRDEDRDTIVNVPGLGNVPVIGRLFRSRDGQGQRTDIILTLTPRVVRARDLPSIGESEFYSGTGQRVAVVNPNDFLEGPVRRETPTIRLDLSGAGADRAVAPPPAAAESFLSDADAAPQLSFQRDAYVSGLNENFTVVITASGFPSATSGRAVIRFRSDVMSVEAVESPQNLAYEIDNESGQVVLELTPSVAGSSTREIATLTFRGRAQGLSYLIFGNAVGASGAQGLPAGTSLRNSRVVVR